MKIRSLFRIDYGHSVFLLALMTILAGSGLSSAATSVWDNGAGNYDLNTASNWNPDGVPDGESGLNIAQWSSAVDRNLTFNANFGYGIILPTNNNGLKIDLTSAQTGTVAINKSGATGNVRFNQITLASGSGAFSIGTSGEAFLWFLGGNSGTTTAPSFINDSANTATIGDRVTLYSGYSNKTRNVTIGGSGNWNISGVVGHTADVSGGNLITLTKTGNGTATLSGANAYTGVTTLSGGILSVATIGDGGVAGNLGAASNAATNLVFNGGTLRYTGTTATSNRAFTINAGQTATLDVTNNSLSLAGATGAATTGALTKTGAGALALTGTNTYTGNTIISAGTLLVNGSLSSASAVQVGASGTLGGHGSVGAISGAGTVAPGNSPGILTALSVDGASGMDFAFEMTALSPTYGDAANSLNDVLRLTAGTPFVTALDGDNTVTVDFSSLSLAIGQTYTGGFYTDANVDFLSSISGANFVFAGADGFTIAVSTVQQTADFGSGNVNGWVTQFDVLAIPEPSTTLLLTGGLMVVVILRRRTYRA